MAERVKGMIFEVDVDQAKASAGLRSLENQTQTSMASMQRSTSVASVAFTKLGGNLSAAGVASNSLAGTIARSTSAMAASAQQTLVVAVGHTSLAEAAEVAGAAVAAATGPTIALADAQLALGASSGVAGSGLITLIGGVVPASGALAGMTGAATQTAGALAALELAGVSSFESVGALSSLTLGLTSGLTEITVASQAGGTALASVALAASGAGQAVLAATQPLLLLTAGEQAATAAAQSLGVVTGFLSGLIGSVGSVFVSVSNQTGVLATALNTLGGYLVSAGQLTGILSATQKVLATAITFTGDAILSGVPSLLAWVNEMRNANAVNNVAVFTSTRLNEAIALGAPITLTASTAMTLYSAAVKDQAVSAAAASGQITLLNAAQQNGALITREVAVSTGQAATAIGILLDVTTAEIGATSASGVSSLASATSKEALGAASNAAAIGVTNLSSGVILLGAAQQSGLVATQEMIVATTRAAAAGGVLIDVTSTEIGVITLSAAIHNAAAAAKQQLAIAAEFAAVGVASLTGQVITLNTVQQGGVFVAEQMTAATAQTATAMSILSNATAIESRVAGASAVSNTAAAVSKEDLAAAAATATGAMTGLARAEGIEAVAAEGAAGINAAAALSKEELAAAAALAAGNMGVLAEAEVIESGAAATATGINAAAATSKNALGGASARAAEALRILDAQLKNLILSLNVAKTGTKGLAAGLNAAAIAVKGLVASLLPLLAVLLPILALFAAIAALKSFISFMKESAELSAIQVLQERRLAAALVSRGLYTRELNETLQAEASALQSVTDVGDETILQIQAILIQFGTGIDIVTDLSEATLDLARTFQIDFLSAATLTAKAVSGNIGALSRYGVKLDSIDVKARGAAAVLEGLNKQFGGRSRAEAATFTGTIARMANAWGDVREKLTDFITRSPAVRVFLLGLVKIMENLSPAITQTTDVLKPFIIKLVDVGIVAVSVAAGIELLANTIQAPDGFFGAILRVLPGIGGLVKMLELLSLATDTALGSGLAESLAAGEGPIAKILAQLLKVKEELQNTSGFLEDEPPPGRPTPKIVEPLDVGFGLDEIANAQITLESLANAQKEFVLKIAERQEFLNSKIREGSLEWSNMKEIIGQLLPSYRSSLEDITSEWTAQIESVKNSGLALDEQLFVLSELDTKYSGLLDAAKADWDDLTSGIENNSLSTEQATIIMEKLAAVYQAQGLKGMERVSDAARELARILGVDVVNAALGVSLTIGDLPNLTLSSVVLELQNVALAAVEARNDNEALLQLFNDGTISASAYAEAQRDLAAANLELADQGAEFHELEIAQMVELITSQEAFADSIGLANAALSIQENTMNRAVLKYDLMSGALGVVSGALLQMAQTGEFSAKRLANAVAAQVFSVLSALAIESAVRGVMELAFASAAAARYDFGAAALHTASAALFFKTAIGAGIGAGVALGVVAATSDRGGGGPDSGVPAGGPDSGFDPRNERPPMQITFVIEGESFIQSPDEFFADAVRRIKELQDRSGSG